MKKLKLNHLSVYLLIGLFVTFLGSCHDDKQSSDVPYNPNVPVKLNIFYPDSGGLATKVILNGDNFGCDANNVSVYFNKKKAVVVRAVGTKLYVLAPSQPGDTCVISVVVGKDSVVYDNKFIYHKKVSVKTIAGKPGTTRLKTGSLAETEFNTCYYVVVDKEENIFISHRGANPLDNSILLINEKKNISTILYSTPQNDGAPQQPGITEDGKTILVPADIGDAYYYFNPIDQWTAKRYLIKHPLDQNADFNIPYKHSFAYCKQDACFYTRSYNGSIIKIDPITRIGTLLMKNIFPGVDSFLNFNPLYSNLLYIVYTEMHCIYIYDINTGKHTLYAGQINKPGWFDGDRLDAEFNLPRQTLFDKDGNLYFAEVGNNIIRKISSDGIVSTVIGQGGVKGYVDGNPDDALFNGPTGVAIDQYGYIYICDAGNRCIRKLSVE